MFKEYNFYVYILFNERGKGTYIGMTNDLNRRMIEHKMGLVEGFTKEKNIKKLGYYEHYQYVNDAIAREKVLKKWERAWKYTLIERMNPDWKDLAAGLDDYIKNMPDPKDMPAEAFAGGIRPKDWCYKK
ncbi:MAG: GIY-YIG nuclease family protein [Rickettsiales bacterium]|jgi:putative endonuclease|nr:GIY-YIG nuclease family protein [Rickettsiales bacterium]